MRGIVIMDHAGGPSIQYEGRTYDLSHEGTAWTLTVRRDGEPDETHTTSGGYTFCRTTEAQGLGFVGFEYGPGTVLRFDLHQRRATLRANGVERVWGPAANAQQL